MSKIYFVIMCLTIFIVSGCAANKTVCDSAQFSAAQLVVFQGELNKYYNSINANNKERIANVVGSLKEDKLFKEKLSELSEIDLAGYSAMKDEKKELWERLNLYIQKGQLQEAVTTEDVFPVGKTVEKLVVPSAQFKTIQKNLARLSEDGSGSDRAKFRRQEVKFFIAYGTEVFEKFKQKKEALEGTE
ncbi:hypothetical protein D0S45_07480 [Marinifilum sp. JC120]|nr:hypothetical protein D0S45_07480 [Marinifilum sp. JC120]